MFSTFRKSLFLLVLIPSVSIATNIFQPVKITTNTTGAGNFIFNTSILQSGSTFYVSSGTVTGQLTYGSLNPPIVISSSSLPSGSTQYIQNTSSLQSGATFYVSAGTIKGNLLLDEGFNVIHMGLNSVTGGADIWGVPYAPDFNGRIGSSAANANEGWQTDANQNWAPTYTTQQVVWSDVGLIRSSAGVLNVTDGSSGFGSLLLTAASAATVPFTVKGAASQTADLTEWQNSSGVVVDSVTANGSLMVGTTFYANMTNGNVGIGTSSPSEKLQVVGGSVLLDNAQAFKIKNAAGAAATILQLDSSDNFLMGRNGGGDSYLDSGTASSNVYIQDNGANNNARFGATGEGVIGRLNQIVWNTSGNVGIGTAFPATKLHLSSGTLTIDGTSPAINIIGNGGYQIKGNAGQLVMQEVKFSATTSSTTATTGFAASDLSQSITTEIANSTVSITACFNATQAAAVTAHQCTYTLYRGSTNLGDSTNGMSWYAPGIALTNTGSEYLCISNFMDVPGAIGTYTYAIYMKTDSALVACGAGAGEKKYMTLWESSQ